MWTSTLNALSIVTVIAMAALTFAAYRIYLQDKKEMRLIHEEAQRSDIKPID